MSNNPQIPLTIPTPALHYSTRTIYPLFDCLPPDEKYHRGFREQVEKWPVHPLDIIIDWLGKYPKTTVADFGCGEARLSASVRNKVKEKEENEIFRVEE